MANYMGFVLLDRCKVNTLQLAEDTWVVPLGTTRPVILLDLIHLAMGFPVDSPQLEGQWQTTHAVAALYVELEGSSLEEAHAGFVMSAQLHYLPLVYMLNSIAEPIAVGAFDVSDLTCVIATFDLPRPRWEGGWVMYNAPTVYRSLHDRLQSDARLRLYMRLFGDVCGETEPQYAVVRAWTLLETMSEVVPKASVPANVGFKEERVRMALRELSVPSDMRTHGWTSEVDDVDAVKAAYRLRNCIVHEGDCVWSNSKCKQHLANEGRCRDAVALSDDIQQVCFAAIMRYAKVGEEKEAGTSYKHSVIRTR